MGIGSEQEMTHDFRFVFGRKVISLMGHRVFFPKKTRNLVAHKTEKLPRNSYLPLRFIMNSIQPTHKNQDEISAARALTDLQNNGSPASLGSRLMPSMPAIEPMGLPAVTAPPPPSSSSPGGKHKANFPMKLYEVLESGKYEDIISWLPGGKAFIITNKKRFATDVLPKYFKQSQFTSFTRKLSRWKFVRVPRGPYMGAYYHKMFRRNHNVLCKLMSCHDNECNLAMLAQAKQEIAESKPSRSVSFVPSVAPPAPTLNQHQLQYIKKLEEMNRIASMKEQLLRIRLRRAQLYEHQKRILLNASMSQKGIGPERHIFQSTPRTIGEAFALEQKKHEIAILSNLNKTGTLPRYSGISNQNPPLNGLQFLTMNAHNGFSGSNYVTQRDVEWYKRNVFNANSA